MKLKRSDEFLSEKCKTKLPMPHLSFGQCAKITFTLSSLQVVVKSFQTNPVSFHVGFNYYLHCRLMIVKKRIMPRQKVSNSKTFPKHTDADCVDS